MAKTKEIPSLSLNDQGLAGQPNRLLPKPNLFADAVRLAHSLKDPANWPAENASGPQVTLSMTDPEGKGEDLQRWLAYLGGKPALSYAERVKRGNVTASPVVEDSPLARLADRAIYAGIKRRWGVVGSVPEYIVDRFDDATGALDHYNQKLLPPNDVRSYAHKDEGSGKSHRPTDSIFHAVAPDDVVFPRLKTDTARDVALALTAAEEYEITRNVALGEQLAEAVRIYSTYVATNGPIGKGRQLIRYALFDNETNDVITVLGSQKPGTVQPGQHVKEVTRDMRSIDDVGNVLSFARKKGRAQSIIKDWRKTLVEFEKNGDDQVLPERVKDRIGMKFVITGRGTEEQQQARLTALVNKVVMALIQHQDSSVRPIVGIYLGETQDNNGQSERFSTIEYNIEYLGIPGFLVLQFETEFQDLRHTYDLGHKNPRTGQLNGAAHDIFEIRRAANLLPYFYPRSSYPRDKRTGENLESLARATEQTTLQKLRDQGRVEVPVVKVDPGQGGQEVSGVVFPNQEALVAKINEIQTTMDTLQQQRDELMELATRPETSLPDSLDPVDLAGGKFDNRLDFRRAKRNLQESREKAS